MKQVGVANEISDVKEVHERICILARTQFSVPKHLDSSLRVEEEVSLTLATTLVSRSVPSIGLYSRHSYWASTTAIRNLPATSTTTQWSKILHRIMRVLPNIQGQHFQSSHLRSWDLEAGHPGCSFWARPADDSAPPPAIKMLFRTGSKGNTKMSMATSYRRRCFVFASVLSFFGKYFW